MKGEGGTLVKSRKGTSPRSGRAPIGKGGYGERRTHNIKPDRDSKQ